MLSLHSPATRIGLAVLPLLLVLSLLPFLLIVRQSFGEPATLDAWRALLLGQPSAAVPFWTWQHARVFLWQPLSHSLLVAGATTLLATGLGAGLAALSALTDLRYSRVLHGIALAHLILPPFALAVAWLGLARALGLPDAWRYGPAPMVGVLVLHFYAFAFLFVGAAARRLDATLIEAAQVHGVTRGALLRGVVLPLLRPAGLASAGLIAFSALAAFAPMQVLGGGSRPYYVLATQVYSLFKSSLGDPTVRVFAVVLALVLTFVSLVPFLLFLRLLGQSRRYGSVGGKGHRAWRAQLGRWRAPLSALCLLFSLASLVVPLAILLLHSLSGSRRVALDGLSLDAYRALLTTNQYLLSLANSFLLAALTATLGVLLTLPIAYAVQRSGSRMLRGALFLLTFLPFLLPGVALGLTFFVLISRPLPLSGGMLSLRFLYGTLGLAVLVSLVQHLPFGVQAQASALLQLDPSLEEAAFVSRAGVARTVRRVLGPLLRHALLVAWLLLFIFVFKEIDVLAFVYAPQPFVTGSVGWGDLLRAPPVMYQVFAMVNSEQDPTLFAQGSALLLLACGVLLLAALAVTRLGWQPFGEET